MAPDGRFLELIAMGGSTPSLTVGDDWAFYVEI
jgi:hypothetical protein